MNKPFLERKDLHLREIFYISMKILFLFPYPHATAASQRFRFEQYLAYLEEKNISYKLHSFLDAKTWEILYQKGHTLRKITGILMGYFGRVRLLFGLGAYEYVFIHREASPLGPPVFEWLIAKVFRKKIIFDFDDAIWLPNTTQSNFIAAGLKFHGKTRLICSWAHKVSAGNAYLANYAKGFNAHVVINPTTIDTQHWHNQIKNQSENEQMVIGWTGTHSTLKYLDELVPILQNLEKEYNFTFLVIANQAPDWQLDSLEFRPWSKKHEITDLLKMNVGVMPLTDDQWAKGKCGFKALQYMALGIPALASPVGVNAEIIDHTENGFLCVNAADWEKYLRQLLENQELRIKLGEKARLKIIDEYSVISNQSNFLSLFE